MDQYQKNIFKKKFPGITEYIGSKTKSKNPVMLIYNKKLICISFNYSYTN